jgi:hypothetical protein
VDEAVEARSRQSLPAPGRLPCGCYGRCACRRTACIGFASAASLALLMTIFLGALIGIKDLGIRRLEAGIRVAAMTGFFMVGLEFTVTAVGTVVVIISKRQRAAPQLWSFAKEVVGLALGTVAGSVLGALLLTLSATHSP